MPSKEPLEDIDKPHALTVIVLTVNNHPGVMSHICGLFSRRAYNLEGIVCLPESTGETSRIWLRVNERAKLDQVLKQLNKLPDIHRVCLAADNQLPEESLLMAAVAVDWCTMTRQVQTQGPLAKAPHPCR